MIKYLAFMDTETNSLIDRNNIESGLPVQITMLISDVETLVPVSAINIFVKQRYLDPGAVAVHGFTAEKLSNMGALTPSDAYELLYENDSINFKWEETAAVAHNSSFDSNIMKRFANQVGKYDKIPMYLDTLKFFRSIKDPNKKNNKLETIVNYLGIPDNNIEEMTKTIFTSTNSYHDARYDTVALWNVVKKMQDEFIKYYSPAIIG